MSRREDRSSESKRHRSRFDREPSPKRSRRDGKPETERPPAVMDVDKDRSDRRHRRLQDPVPPDSGNVSRESEKGADVPEGAAKHSSDPKRIPQSRSFFQHDDRGSAGQNGRGFSRRTDSGRDPKEQRNDRSTNKIASIDVQLKDEKSKDKRDSNHAWRHDGYFEMEANPEPPIRRRPSFREQKIPADPEKTNKAADNPVMRNPQDHAIDDGRRNDRGHNSRYSVAGEREFNKAQSWRGNFSSGDRSNGYNRHSGRDSRFTAARQGYQPTGERAEKWKHDLYDEANKSPPPKNDEDQISKIEALLAS